MVRVKQLSFQLCLLSRQSIGVNFMGNLIITISREFGSGGRAIGERLARQLSIPFYDKEILQKTAEKSGLSQEFIENAESHSRKSFLFAMATAPYNDMKFSYQYETPITDQAYFAQSQVIRDLADTTNCVIVGRCADYILREEEKLFRVFIIASPEDRRRRVIEEYGIAEKDANSKIKKADKSRSSYVLHYTGEEWGDPKNYDLVINTSYSGIDGAVEIIKSALRIKGYVK